MDVDVVHLQLDLVLLGHLDVPEETHLQVDVGVEVGFLELLNDLYQLLLLFLNLLVVYPVLEGHPSAALRTRALVEVQLA